MRYALLVCVEERGELTEADAERRHAEFMAFQDEMVARGVLVARGRLRPLALATTVRVRDEGLVVADRPFAETTEQIAGFYIIECANLDDAIEIASAIPAPGRGRSGRCGRSSGRASSGRRRVPLGLGTGRCLPDPRDRQLGSGRGVHPGRIRAGARALAAR